MPQDYYERQEARRERYELRAERARQESNAATRQAEKMASIIPMGQPILVGHHSEGRDRRYRARIGQTMDKAISLDKKAAYYEEKAESVGQSGISSDAPDALERLEKKLAESPRMDEGSQQGFQERRCGLARPRHDAGSNRQDAGNHVELSPSTVPTIFSGEQQCGDTAHQGTD